MSELRDDRCQDVNDKLLLTGQRAAQREDWAAVMAAADEVLKNEPNCAEALFLSAIALRKAGSEGVAAELLNVASKIDPSRAVIWQQLAVCLHERHPLQAYQYALKAQTLKPDQADTLSVLCNVASTLGKHEEALQWAARCEAEHGEHGEVSHNKSFALFALGRWKEGWEAFKPSLGMENRRIRNYHMGQETPRWNPDFDRDAVVAIYGEQGMGDEVLYASMIDAAAKAAHAKGSRVVIECSQRNAGLFARSLGAPVYGTRAEMYCDWPRDEGVTHKLEMGGLGEFFGQKPFRRQSYLKADTARAAMWDAWFGKRLRPRIGIAWTGGTWETGRLRRSVPFDDFVQLIRRDLDADFVNLEYEDRRSELEFTAVPVFDPNWATRKGADMDDLAAILTNLDLVISVQTSVVDYAGALGVPCWAITDQVPQWRYTGFFGPDTMGFYKSVKTYRQEKWGEWTPVIEQINADLTAWRAGRRAAA